MLGLDVDGHDPDPGQSVPVPQNGNQQPEPEPVPPKRRRHAVQWGDDVVEIPEREPAPLPVSDALEPEQRRRGRRRTVKWGDEVVEAPEPVLEPEHEHEPEPERIESDEQRWRQLARLTGRGAAVSRRAARGAL